MHSQVFAKTITIYTGHWYRDIIAHSTLRLLWEVHVIVGPGTYHWQLDATVVPTTFLFMRLEVMEMTRNILESELMVSLGSINKQQVSTGFHAWTLRCYLHNRIKPACKIIALCI